MLRWSVLVSIGLLIPWWSAEPERPRHVPPAAHRLQPAVIFIGDVGPAVPRARMALERVLATPVGAKARELLDAGVLRGPLVIDLNHRGENFTAYRVPGFELGETILFDPWSRPLVETEHGPEEAAPETVLAHELGHAVFKLTSEEAVIEAIENPIRAALGMSRRSRF
jgi:hypothetical protein